MCDECYQKYGKKLDYSINYTMVCDCCKEIKVVTMYPVSKEVQQEIIKEVKNESN